MPDKNPLFIDVNAIASSKPRKSDRTRTVILNAALEFLWAHPFREMTDVCYE